MVYFQICRLTIQDKDSINCKLEPETYFELYGKILGKNVRFSVRYDHIIKNNLSNRLPI